MLQPRSLLALHTASLAARDTVANLQKSSTATARVRRERNIYCPMLCNPHVTALAHARAARSSQPKRQNGLERQGQRCISSCSVMIALVQTAASDSLSSRASRSCSSMSSFSAARRLGSTPAAL